MKNVYGPIGSVSSATHRPEHLVPAYVRCLDGIRDDLRRAGRTPEALKLSTYLAQVEATTSADEYDFDGADDLVNELADMLSEYAPPYFYFGSHPGYGADFGFWLSQECFDEAVENEEIVKCDELPEQYDPEKQYAVVNDHGNVTLYAYDDEEGGLKEVWAIV